MNKEQEKSDDANATKNRVGMKAAKTLLALWGFSEIEPVDSLGKGWDFEASKNGVRYKIELKTTETRGVPDAFGNEFENLDSLPELKADYLLVVKVKKDEASGFRPLGGHFVSKEEVGGYKDHHRVVNHVKFSHKFQTDLANEKVGEWKNYEED